MTGTLALALLLAAPSVDVTFAVREHLPPQIEVVRLVRPVPGAPWQIADLRVVEIRSGRFTLSGPAGSESLVVVRAPGRPGYLLHGPLRWPAEPTDLEIDPEWRRTVRGQYPSTGDLTWVSPVETSARVLCEWTLPGKWECLGVPRAADGVVVRSGTRGLFYSVVAGSLGPRNDVEDVPSASAAWGRLLVLQDLTGFRHQREAPTVRARALRLYRPPARPASTRFEAAPDGRIRIDPVGPTAFWVAGSTDAPDGWIELQVPGAATGRVEFAELTGGPPEAMFPVPLQRPGAVFGRVTGPMASPVAGAIVSLYRFGRDVRFPDKKTPRRERIAVGEQTTDEDGAFSFDDLPPERYELLAVQAGYGRAVKAVDSQAGEILLTLRPPPALEGRVLRDGVPQERVAVAFVPDLAAFAAAEDPTELHGGETETDADGRFRVFASIAGAGELKIGSAPGPITRVPLSAAEALPSVTTLGDIELAGGPSLTIVFEEAGECQPMLTGPVGRTGLTVVRTTRNGPAIFSAALPEGGQWNIVALCAGHERAVVPSTIVVASDSQEMTATVRWP
jgi:hypothetical protein